LGKEGESHEVVVAAVCCFKILFGFGGKFVKALDCFYVGLFFI
jgi:hypothetical protein